MRALTSAVAAASWVAVFGSAARAETVERRLDVDGAARTYRIHVPPTWDRARPVAVLFVFHGAGSDPESMVAATGFDALAAEHPMLVVYPRAAGAGKRYEVDPPPGRASADVRFFDALLARLRERFPVDGARVFATGFSNGAAFCYRLAAERPGSVAAIAPVAGYLPEGLPGGAPVPTIHVHGAADRRVAPPPDGERSWLAAWASRGGAVGPATTEAVRAVGGLLLHRRRFRGPTPRSDVDLLLVQGGDHVWSGGPGGAVSRAILEFLAAHAPSSAPPTAAPGGPLVGTPFGATAALRALPPRDDGTWTLHRWWTNACAHCTGSVPALARVAARHGSRGLRMVAVYHPKNAPLSDDGARAYARRLGFDGAVAFDDRWAKYLELRERGALRAATSVTVLVDPGGVVRWVHPGPRIEEGSADLAALEAALDRLLQAAPTPVPHAAR